MTDAADSEPGEYLAEGEPGSGEPETDASQPPAPKPLPEHVEDCDGSWLYTLQHPLEPSKDDPKGDAIGKVRVRKRIYARDVLASARGNPTSRAEAAFNLACSLTTVPADILRRFDLRDYEVVSDLVERSGTPNATANPR